MKTTGIEWVTHSPSPYNDHLFATLHRSLPFPLMVHYRYPGHPGYPWRTPLRTGYESRVYDRRFGVDWRLLAEVRKPGRMFVTSSWEDVTSQLAILECAARGRRYMTFNDTPNPFKVRNWWKERARAAFLRFAFRHAWRVLGTGWPALRQLERMGCPPEKLVDFPYCIDMSRYDCSATPDAEPLRFGSCGALTEVKGFDLALRGLARAFRDRPNAFHYEIAGDGPERERLAALARQLGIAKRVQFTGWLEPTEVPAFFSRLHFFLHPARFEAYGVVVLEAIASRVVVIASSETAAALDGVRHGVGGFLHQANDPDSLADSIRLACTLTFSERAEMAERTHAWLTLRGADRAALRLEVLAA